MRTILAALAATVLTNCAGVGGAPVFGRTAYIGGSVFDGERFVTRDLVVENGRIIDARASSAADRIDLEGGFVTPPFCEAHNHNLGREYENREMIARYLSEGIFYVGTLSNLPALTDPVRVTYNTPRSVDTIFGNGGLTAAGGHPIRLREFLLEQGVYPGFTRETLADHAYFVIDNEADLDRRWPIIASFNPDFIKIFLLFSEEYERRRDDERYFGFKGLDPALVPLIVERAHAAGLRVFAHVESGHDFHIAVEAGVDVIAHLPGSTTPTVIDPADARLAAERSISVMTTAQLINRSYIPEATREALRTAQIANLAILRDAGVRFAAGSDEVGETSRAEIAHLRGLNVFSNAELLRMWSTDCARTLYPDRRVGALGAGDEASFLVLGGDPLADFEAVRDIRLRVKQGVTLDASAVVG